MYLGFWGVVLLYCNIGVKSMNKQSIKKISGKSVEDYTHFLFDGCHKFYLLKSGILTENLKNSGWEQSDVYPIDVLPDMYSGSCPLRFINEAETFKTIVPQFQNIITFKNFGYRNYRINFNKIKDFIKVW